MNRDENSGLPAHWRQQGPGLVQQATWTAGQSAVGSGRQSTKGGNQTAARPLAEVNRTLPSPRPVLAPTNGPAQAAAQNGFPGTFVSTSGLNSQQITALQQLAQQQHLLMTQQRQQQQAQQQPAYPQPHPQVQPRVQPGIAAAQAGAQTQAHRGTQVQHVRLQTQPGQPAPPPQQQRQTYAAQEPQQQQQQRQFFAEQLLPRPQPRQSRQQQQQAARKQPGQDSAVAEAADDGLGDGVEDSCFAAFSTDEFEAAGLRPHPDKIAETSALASVPVPAVSYRLSLPFDMMAQGKISAAQFMAVRLACAKHETFLKDGSRAGFFLGDGPGVGKGRQIAASILENFAKGRKKAVWLSASADLVVDAERDLGDIGALKFDGVKLLPLKDVKAGERNLSRRPDWAKGVLFSTYDLLISGEGGRRKNRRASGTAAGSSKRASETPGAGEMGAYGAAGAGDAEGKEQADDEFGEGSRLAQLVEWFGGAEYDGLIVLDECHKAKNCLPKESETSDGRALKQKESKTSRAVVELQRRCRNARVLYVSATGATESENLCYMERLGLWGEGTAYETKKDFVNMLKTYGVRAMELVAMELKQNGSYLARTLSYENVKFELVPVRVTGDFKALYDAAAELWQELLVALKAHVELLDKQGRKEMYGQFYGAQLRFFKQLCTAGKVDEVERLTKEALARGQCVVIGLQSTGEARTAAYVAAHGGCDAEFDTFSFETSAQEILLDLIAKYLPAGARDVEELRQKARELRLPGNPLDDLIDRLGGPAGVAEMTGRSKRMERQPGGGFKYVTRNAGSSLDKANLREKEDFQAGDKLVAIISDAASTGISLQADLSKRNQRQRVHITLELAWSADKTVQQLGRTHRSNQAQPPLYMIVSSDISGEHRFASAVASRLMQLGALTHGDRNAVSAVDVLAGSNFHNTYGPRALSKLYRCLRGALSLVDPISPVYGITPEWLRNLMADKGLEPGSVAWQAERAKQMLAFIEVAVAELEAVGLLKEDKDGSLVVTGGMMKEKNTEAGGSTASNGNTGGVNRLLNRLLAVRVDMQQRIFQLFNALLDAEVQEAKRKGEYETGIVRPTCGDIKLRSQEVIMTSPDDRVSTTHFEFHLDRGVPYEEAMRIYKQEKEEDPETHTHFVFTVNDHNGMVFVSLAIERNERGRKVNGRGRNRTSQPLFFRLVRPGTGYANQDIDRDECRRKYTAVSEDRLQNGWLKARWREEYNRSQHHRQLPLHLISGSLLPLLPALDAAMRLYTRKHALKVMRVVTSDGRTQVLGIHVDSQRAADVVAQIRKVQPYKEARSKVGDGEAGPSAQQPAAAAAAAPAPAVAPGVQGARAAGAATAVNAPHRKGGDGGSSGSSSDSDSAGDGGGSGSSSEDEEVEERRRARATAARRRKAAGGVQGRRRRASRADGGEGEAERQEEDMPEGERARRAEALHGAGLWEESAFLELKKDDEPCYVPGTAATGAKRRGRPPKATPPTAAGTSGGRGGTGGARRGRCSLDPDSAMKEMQSPFGFAAVKKEPRSDGDDEQVAGEEWHGGAHKARASRGRRRSAAGTAARPEATRRRRASAKFADSDIESEEEEEEAVVLDDDEDDKVATYKAEDEKGADEGPHPASLRADAKGRRTPRRGRRTSLAPSAGAAGGAAPAEGLPAATPAVRARTGGMPDATPAMHTSRSGRQIRPSALLAAPDYVNLNSSGEEEEELCGGARCRSSARLASRQPEAQAAGRRGTARHSRGIAAAAVISEQEEEDADASGEDDRHGRVSERDDAAAWRGAEPSSSDGGDDDGNSSSSSGGDSGDEGFPGGRGRRQLMTPAARKRLSMGAAAGMTPVPVAQAARGGGDGGSGGQRGEGMQQPTALAAAAATAAVLAGAGAAAAGADGYSTEGTCIDSDGDVEMLDEAPPNAGNKGAEIPSSHLKASAPGKAPAGFMPRPGDEIVDLAALEDDVEGDKAKPETPHEKKEQRFGGPGGTCRGDRATTAAAGSSCDAPADDGTADGVKPTLHGGRRRRFSRAVVESSDDEEQQKGMDSNGKVVAGSGANGRGQSAAAPVPAAATPMALDAQMAEADEDGYDEDDDDLPLVRRARPHAEASTVAKTAAKIVAVTKADTMTKASGGAATTVTPRAAAAAAAASTPARAAPQQAVANPLASVGPERQQTADGTIAAGYSVSTPPASRLGNKRTATEAVAVEGEAAAGGIAGGGRGLSAAKAPRLAGTPTASAAAAAVKAAAAPAMMAAAPAANTTSSGGVGPAARVPVTPSGTADRASPWPEALRPAPVQTPQPLAFLDLTPPVVDSQASHEEAAPAAAAAPNCGVAQAAVVNQQQQQETDQQQVAEEQERRVAARVRAQLESEWSERLKVERQRHDAELTRLREEHQRDLKAKLELARAMGRKRAEEELQRQSQEVRQEVERVQRAAETHRAEALRLEQQAKAQQEELQRQQATAAAAQANAELISDELKRARGEAEAARCAMEELRKQLSLLQGQQQQPERLRGVSGPAASVPTPTGRSAMPAGVAPVAGSNLPRASPIAASGVNDGVCKTPPLTAMVGSAYKGAQVSWQPAATPSATPQHRQPMITPPQPPSRPVSGGVPAAVLTPGTSQVRTGNAAIAVAPTPDSIRAFIAAHEASGGITAAAMVRHFETAAGGMGAGGHMLKSPILRDMAIELRNKVAKALQGLVDDFEVGRRGAGASSGTVDVACEQTFYFPI